MWLGSSSPENSDATLSYARGLWIRAVVALVFLALFLVLNLIAPDLRIRGQGGLTVLLSVLVLVNPLLWWVGRVRGFPTGDFYVHWVMDIAAVTAIVHFLGGVDVSIAAAAYMVMIVSSATFATARASWALAGAASGCYVAVIVAEYTGVLDHYHVGAGPHVYGDAQVISVSGAIVFFFVFAYLAGTLAGQLRRRSDEIALQKVNLEDSLRKEQASREGLVTLSTIVQHDIYGPLGVVAGACVEARKGCEAGDLGEARRWLGQIRERIRSIEGAVASLGVIGIGDEEQEGNVEVFEVVQQVVADLRPEWSERQVRTETAGSWPVVTLSRAALYHVLRNLVSNAVRSVAADGTGCVIVRSRCATLPNRGWELSIEDNGPGLPANVRGRLHDRPQGRIRLGMRREGKFGVGLSLAQVLASSWDGGISYEEDESGGPRLVVRIPLQRVRDPIV